MHTLYKIQPVRESGGFFMRINTRSALYGAVLLTAASIFTQGVGFAYRIYLTRVIGAEGMGLFSLIMSVYAIVMSLTVSGLAVTVSRLTAEYSARRQPGAVSALLRRCFMLFLGLWSIAALVVLPFSDAISAYLLGDARTRSGLVLLLFCILFTGFENIFKNHFYGRKSIHQPAFSESVEIVVRYLSVMTLFVLFKPDHLEFAVALVVGGMVISEIGSALILRVLYGRSRLPPVASEIPRAVVTRQMKGVVLPTITSSFLTNFIGSVSSILIPSRLMLSGLSSSQALSAFGAMTGMTLPFLMLPFVVTSALSLVMIPRLTENVARGELAQARRRAGKTLLILLVLLVPVYGLLMVFGPSWVVGLYQNEAAGAYMVPLCAASLIVNVQAILSSVLVGFGHHTRVAANNILSGLLQLALIWFLVAEPRLQMGGFVIALLVSDVVGTLLFALDTVRSFGGKIKSPGHAA